MNFLRNYFRFLSSWRTEENSQINQKQTNASMEIISILGMDERKTDDFLSASFLSFMIKRSQTWWRFRGTRGRRKIVVEMDTFRLISS